MNICEIFRSDLYFFLHFQRASYPSFPFASFFAVAIAIVSSSITGVHPRLWFIIRGPVRRPARVIDRLALDRARSTLHVQYFLITLYTVLLEVGPHHTSGSWTGAPLRGGEGGENGPTERARRGNCAPTSGSPVAPSRTCRLFPRRDSRSPHLSSVRPASPNSPLFPAPSLTLSPPTAHVCTAGTGQRAGHAYLFLDIFGLPRERYTLRAHNLRRTRLVDIQRVSWDSRERVEKYSMHGPTNRDGSFRECMSVFWREIISKACKEKISHPHSLFSIIIRYLLNADLFIDFFNDFFNQFREHYNVPIYIYIHRFATYNYMSRTLYLNCDNKMINITLAGLNYNNNHKCNSRLS